MDKLISQDSQDLSIEEERKVAKTFMGRIEWEMIVIGLGQFTLWLVIWSLVVQSIIPLWIGFFLTTITTAFAYLPSHAGQHGHLSGRHKNLIWLNSVVGQISLIPLAQSHDILKATHLKHHAHTNDPEKDPDYGHTHVNNWRQSALNIHFQTGNDGKLLKMVEKFSQEDPSFKLAMERGGLFSLLFFFSQMVVAVFYPLETLFLWWLPRKLATSYLGIIFSMEPHNKLPKGRYLDTRFWSNGMPRFLNHSMQIHAMHHMYPSICHFDEPKAIEALMPFMIERGMPNSEKIPKKVTANSLTHLIN
tara:strand:+ start:509 stop:1420 length:912 start_codon:yes stop_codon:yes gene_type:complete